MSTAVVSIPSPGHYYPGHPEDPARFSDLVNWDLKPYAHKLEWLTSTPADPARIATVHSHKMIAEVEKACLRAPAIIDYAPTYVTQSSARDAFNAAGGVLACTQAVLSGQDRNAFAMIRPPGHHAEPEAAMGFCIFNNVAIAARLALEQGLGQVMIVDFDAHHGNGTQATFWQEPRVAYFSTHQEGIYPGSGHMEEAPHARGRIVNLPLPAYSGDQTFSVLTQEVLFPLVDPICCLSLPDSIPTGRTRSQTLAFPRLVFTTWHSAWLSWQGHIATVKLFLFWKGAITRRKSHLVWMPACER